MNKIFLCISLFLSNSINIIGSANEWISLPFFSTTTLAVIFFKEKLNKLEEENKKLEEEVGNNKKNAEVFLKKKESKWEKEKIDLTKKISSLEENVFQEKKKYKNLLFFDQKKKELGPKPLFNVNYNKNKINIIKEKLFNIASE